MSDIVIIADAAAPLEGSAAAAGALGLASAFAARPPSAATGAGVSKRVFILTQADSDRAARQPGLARRLRMVSASVGGAPLEVPLFEGRAASSGANLFVLAVPPSSRGRTAALLGSAVTSLIESGLMNPDLVVGWGDTSARALAALPRARRVLVLPDGTAGPPLPAEELNALGEADDLGAGASLLARALMEADAVAVPSPAAAAALAGRPELADRPSDQPLAIVRLGCDDPPHDPQSDPALGHRFSTEALAGKGENRRALARSLSLAVGQRTLVCVAPQLTPGAGGGPLLEVLAQLAGLDVAVVVPPPGPAADRGFYERMRILAIEHPGKVALIAEDRDALTRELYAAADAALFLDAHDLTGRAAGLALRYGALPIAPDAGAFGDFLVDYDPASATGSALLYAPGNAFELLGGLRRALALRTDAERWSQLVTTLLRSAPRWSGAAALIDGLVEAAPAPLAA